MIQIKSRLCLGAMKLVQWPSLSRGVSRALWPAQFKVQMSVLPYCCSSTAAQAHKNDQDELVESRKEGTSRKTSTTHSANEGGETLKQKQEVSIPRTKELDAVLRVKSLSAAVELSSTFTPQQRLEALRNLAIDQLRPLTLIQTLTEGLSESMNEFNIKELSDLLFVLNKLRYLDENILSKTCDAMKSQLGDTKAAAVVGSSVSSLTRLQWKDPELLDLLSVWVQEHFSKYQKPSSFVYSLAMLNHSPTNLEELLKLVWMDMKMQKHSSVDLINLVWSINVLNCPHFKDEMRETLDTVFKPQFLNTLGSDSFYIPVWIKLWNLHGLAKKSWGLAVDDLKIPEVMKSKILNQKRSDKDAMVSVVSQLLFKDLDKNIYSTNVSSQMGFPIDLVFSLDSKMNAVPFNLSSDCSRIAVMIHSFHECCQPSKEPNGFRVFEMRLLEDEYNVISVPYDILSGGYTQVHQYFESMLSKVVQK